MADKAISELIAAERITSTDMFVLEQNGSAKRLTGQVLLNWLTAAADGHGGIQSIAKIATNGLVDTYRITLADLTAVDFFVTNARSVTGISKISTSGLLDNYRITYNDDTFDTFTVTNGDKGDKGDSQYVWIKYASQEPTASSSSFGDIPDNWIGIYSGESETAPTDWAQYKWFEIKGETGNTGDPAIVVSQKVEYQVGTSGTIIPSGTWSEIIPPVPQANYLWTRNTVLFNSGAPMVSYSVGRMGIDGLGSVVTVNDISPDESGNVLLTAESVGALPDSGGVMKGGIDMNGQFLSGVNEPKNDTDAANKAYVDKMLPKAGGTMTGPIAMGDQRLTGLPQPEAAGDAATKGYVDNKRKVFIITLLSDNWVGTSAPYTQSAAVEGILAADMPVYGPVYSADQTSRLAQKEAFALVDDLDTAEGSVTFTCFEEKPAVNISIQMEVNR